MNCSHIIDDMVWSYSRITSYETCPYRFFLTYILKLEKKRLFFSDYGSFIHSIIEKYLNGELKKK
ncbi:MAG: PD-(D/E)XK nuclease family protein, partial [Agathobacter sp.]